MDCDGRSLFGKDYRVMDKAEDATDSDLEARLYAEVYYTSDIPVKFPKEKQLTTITDIMNSWKNVSEKVKISLEKHKQNSEKNTVNPDNENTVVAPNSKTPVKSLATMKNQEENAVEQSLEDLARKENTTDSTRKVKQSEIPKIPSIVGRSMELDLRDKSSSKTDANVVDGANVTKQKNAKGSTIGSAPSESSQQSNSQTSEDSVDSSSSLKSSVHKNGNVEVSKAKMSSQRSSTDNNSSSSGSDSDNSSTSTTEDESEENGEEQKSKKSPKQKFPQKKYPRKSPTTMNTFKSQNSPKLAGNTGNPKRKQFRRSKPVTSFSDGPFVVLDSSSDSAPDENSKYNVANKRKTSKNVELIKVEDSDNNCYELSDSNDSILEVPVPPKPKPPTINLQDSDNACTERESDDETSNSSSDSSNSDEEMEHSEARSKKRSVSQEGSSQLSRSEEYYQSLCLSDISSQEGGLMPTYTETSETPSCLNSRDHSQSSVPVDMEIGPSFLNTENTVPFSAASPQTSAKNRFADPVLRNLILNCTEIQKGAASLADIRSLGVAVENENRGNSDDSMTENEASSWGIIADGQRTQIDQQPEESYGFENVTGVEKCTIDSSAEMAQPHDNRENEVTDGIEKHCKGLENVSTKGNQVLCSIGLIENHQLLSESGTRQLQGLGNPAEGKERFSRSKEKSQDNSLESSEKSLENYGESAGFPKSAEIVSERVEKYTEGRDMRDRKGKSSESRKRLSESLGRLENGDKRARYFDAEKELDSSGSGLRVQKNESTRKRSRSMSDYFFKPMTDEMKKFYNESWGGEDFDLARVRGEMSKDPRNWAILDADLAGSRAGKGGRYWASGKCNNCRQFGHTRATCPEARKIIKCHMCGVAGHRDSRCPEKKCLSCGKKQRTYTTSCNACRDLRCYLCKSSGHRKENCPDLWRRYHQTMRHTFSRGDNNINDNSEVEVSDQCGEKRRRTNVDDSESRDEDAVSSQPTEPTNRMISRSLSSIATVGSESDRESMNVSCTRISRVSAIHESRLVSQDRAEMITQALARMIAQDMLPLSFSENEGFRSFMSVVEPGYTVPSKTTVHKRVEMTYGEAHAKVADELNAASSIALSTDMWTSVADHSYITVTAHHLDKQWTPVVRTLTTESMEVSHTAQSIEEKLREVTAIWKIDKKVHGIVHDNGSSISLAARNMDMTDGRGDIPCSAHTLQLSVKKGLETDTCAKLCEKSSKIVGHFRHSSKASMFLRTKQIQLGLPVEKLIQSCPKRWNSTYYMFQRFLNNRAVISAVLEDRSTTQSAQMRKLETTEMDWSNIESMCKVLKPFEVATTVLCSDKTTTLSMVRPIMHSLINNHLSAKDDDDHITVTVKLACAADLSRRFQLEYVQLEEEENEDLQCIRTAVPFLIASFLDPRYKGLSLENDIFKEKAIAEVRELIRVVQIESKGEQIVEEPTNALDFLFQMPSSGADELSRYQALPEANIHTNPLSWWRLHAKSFPQLADLAKKYLAIPATSASSQRVFSTAGNVASKKRNCLSPNNVDMLVFLYENRSLLSS